VNKALDVRLRDDAAIFDEYDWPRES